MTVMTSLARLLAAESGLPQHLTAFRHLHIVGKPMVMVPVTLAGETNAPLAVMIGNDQLKPRLIVTRQPRVRAERLTFAADLAADLLYDIKTMAADTEPADGKKRPEPGVRAKVAPQIWVPNSSGIDFIGLLGRMTRLRQTTGQWAVAPAVKELGIWLTWFAEQAEFVDSSVLVATTNALSDVWATGQSAVEDGNLAALMAWLAPPGGLTVADAVRRAEDPTVCPPAGPATDPEFDRLFLEPILRDIANAPNDTIRSQVVARMASALRQQMQPTWDMTWEAIGLLRDVPEAPRVSERWRQQRDRFTAFAAYLQTGGHPQAKRDGAVRSAQRLLELEQRLGAFEVQRAYDDPLVMADHRILGEAFAGRVTAAEPLRRIPGPSRPVLRPLVTIETTDRVLVDVGDELHVPRRRGQKVKVMEIAETAGNNTTTVLVELQNQMGGKAIPNPGSVPDIGDMELYTKLKEDFPRQRQWPRREETPWTHGGPPPQYIPAPDDAAEDWS